VKIVLFLADLLGLGNRLGRGTRMICFAAWPKDRRVRYWASDIEKVMISKEPEPGHDWYSIRVFARSGDAADYTISKSTFDSLENSNLNIVWSPKLRLPEREKTT